MSLDQLTPKEIGERLRISRETAGVTQADAAASVGVARTTLIAMEKGERRVRVNEIQRLAQLYGTTANALLRKEAVHVDLAPRFRKLADSSDSAAGEAVKLLSELAIAEVELENLLGVQRTRNYPPERPILRGDVVAQAEQDALELRQRLGFGMSPVSNIVALLELELGVRVYIRKLDARISGLFAYDDAIGPCILLNANHRIDRRTQSAAHECGHFVSTRTEPEILHEDETFNSREERYANAFGRSFLTPARAVVQKFHEVIAGSKSITRRHIIVLAHFFGVSREAMTRRLEELKLVKSGTWEWFEANGGITDAQELQVLGDLRMPDAGRVDANRPTTLRLNMLAAEAYEQGLLSEGQLARLLHVDRVEIREMLDSLDFEGSDAHGADNLLD